MSNISGMRIAYNERTNLFLEDNIEVKDPFCLFRQWFEEARSNPMVPEPNAVCLATATRDGMPSARYILLKGCDESGFKFYTHYTSRKGQELEENPNAAITFYWAPFHRCVRVEGTVEKLSSSDADEYFKSRPYQSQIGALCSDQSKPIEGRHVLFQKEAELKEKYTEGCVPRPKHWGGYVLIPKCFEFWQGQTDRIHDRIRFRFPVEDEKPDNKYIYQGENGWIYERLAP